MKATGKLSICETKYLIYTTPLMITVRNTIKFILWLIGSVWYSGLLRCLHPNYVEKKYTISLCAIFRDEAPYLKEWIELHRLIGIQHFYMYNNLSRDNYMEVLDEYIRSELVTLVDWPYKLAQMEAYADCVEKYSDETNWIGFIDLDEFVVPVKENNMTDILCRFKNRPVLVLQWKLFGSSGIRHRNLSGLVIEDFTSSWPKYADIGKIFFNTGYDYWSESDQDMHERWARYRGIKLPSVNIQDRPCFLGFNHISKNHLDAQINHYVIKSYDEYFGRKSKMSGGVHDVGVHDKEYWNFHEIPSTSEDLVIKRYISELKESMHMKKSTLNS